MKRFLVYLILVSLLLPYTLNTEAQTVSMSDRMSGMLKEMQEARTEFMKGSGANTVKPEEPLFVDVKGEKIPVELTKLPLFQEGKVEVFILLNDPPIIEKASNAGADFRSPSLIPYQAILSNSHTNLLSSARSVGLNITPRYEFFYTLNGYYTEVSISDLAKLRALPNVKTVQFPTIYEIDDRYALDILRAPTAWTAPYSVKGEGQVIAIVDTGVDYNHPDLGAGFGAGKKVIGGRDFGGDITRGVPDDDPMDRHSHGTHVAGIAAGKAATSTGINGVAPEAKIVAYKIVFQNEGSSVSGAIAAAFEHMVTFVGPAGERVTSANLSFGAAAGFYNAADASEIAMNNAVTAGIFVAGSAGNNAQAHNQFTTVSSTGRTTIYPSDIGVTGSPNTAAQVISVAASSNSHQDLFTSFRVVGTSPVRRSPYTIGSGSPNPVTHFSGNNIEVVPIPSFGNIPANYTGLTMTGKIALVQRGGLTGEDASFVNKIQQAQNAGSAGIIVYNDAARGEAQLTMATAAGLTIPRVFTGNSHGVWLINNPSNRFINFDGDPTPIQIPLPENDQMATFSSWGLTPGMGPKPEITAPGSPIWSTDLVTFASTTYSHKSGTSMASPYVAGVGALIKQYRPSFTPLMIKTALVNTASLNIGTTTTYRASARLQGGGRVDIPRALDVPALLSGTNNEVFLSYGDTDGATTLTFPMKVRNLSGTALTYTPATTVRRTTSTRAVTTYAGITPAFTMGGSPVTSITVPASGEVNFEMVLTIGAITVDQTFGEGHLILTPTAGTTIPLSIPYVFFVGDYQSVAYRNPATGVTAFADNMVMDTLRDEYWYWYGFTWLAWSPSPFTALYYLGGNHANVISRDKIAISPNGDDSQDNLWPILSFMRGTRDFKVQIRGGGLTTPLNIISETFIRKNGVYQTAPAVPYRTGWVNSWRYTPALPEGNYFIDYIAEAMPDPSAGDPATFQTITLPFKIDVTPPVNALTGMSQVGSSITLNWTSSDPVNAGTSGVWGHRLSLIPLTGSPINSPFLAPDTTTYTFTSVPTTTSYSIALVTWDFAGNATLTPFSSPIILKTGWNVLGTSSIPSNPVINQVFPNCTVWWFNTSTGRYEKPANVEMGKSYWVRSASDTTYTISETYYRFSTNESWTLGAGWNNLENPYFIPIQLNTLVFRYRSINYSFHEAVANRLISSTVYRYDPALGYVVIAPTDSITPRVGFLLRTFAPDITLIVNRP